MALLDTLSRSARTAYPFIQRGVREGLSANSIQASLQAAGIGIRRQALLDVIRAESGAQLASSALRFAKPETFPNPARLGEALTKIRRQFSFTVEVRGTLGSTGEGFIQHVTVSTDRLLTRQAIEDAAQAMVEDEQERYGIDVGSVVLTGGLRSGSLGVF